jgi:hypothetical protein
MLQRSKGFLLTEMLLSLSALAVTALFLLPAINFIWEKGEQLQFEKNARQLLFHDLMKQAANTYIPIERYETIDGKVYKVFINTLQDGNREVCVGNGEPTVYKEPVCSKIE